MKIKGEILEYLNGEKFSSGYHFKIDEKFFPKDRIEKILEIVKQKRVIHLGCCDHIPLIKEKIENRTWLHGLLTEKCSEVLGVDINEEGIEYLKKEIGCTNVKCANLLKENVNEIIENNKVYDYIILGEILEHVNNPVEFLGKLSKDYSKNITKIIITVPNILCKFRIEKTIECQSEAINSDHKYWFTPYTLLKVAKEAGLDDYNLYFVDPLIKRSKIQKLKRSLEKRLNKGLIKYNFYDFGTLILEAKLK